MLTIFNLHAKVGDNEILKGVNLKVNAGEVHAIMGPNGSGKSTLAGVLAGRDLYKVTEGDVLFEGNPIVARALQTHPRLAGVKRLSIFISPLSKEEIAYLKAPERNVSLQDLLTDVMRRKLLRRTRRQKGDLSAKDLENVETRASSAYRELQGAWHFQYVIPNHDGEDSDNWEAFYYLIGDARKTLDAFVGLLKGFVPPGVEKWEEDLLPSES